MQSAVIVVCILRTAGLQDAVDKMMEQYRVRGISQGIVDFLALPPGLQETCVPEAPEVMGHRRGAHAGGSADIENALLAVAEQPENADSVCISETLKDLCNRCKTIDIRKLFGEGFQVFMCPVLVR